MWLALKRARCCGVVTSDDASQTMPSIVGATRPWPMRLRPLQSTAAKQRVAVSQSVGSSRQRSTVLVVVLYDRRLKLILIIYNYTLVVFLIGHSSPHVNPPYWGFTGLRLVAKSIALVSRNFVNSLLTPCVVQLFQEIRLSTSLLCTSLNTNFFNQNFDLVAEYPVVCWQKLQWHLLLRISDATTWSQ